MKFLVTGGAGFIGSAFVRLLLGSAGSPRVINLDKLTYAGNLENLDTVAGHANYRFVHGDICDAVAGGRAFDRRKAGRHRALRGGVARGSQYLLPESVI